MSRLCFAAAHVVWHDSYRLLDHSLAEPGTSLAIAEHVDWDATMSLRQHLDRLGFGVAEAMDTAQRFFVGWPVAEQLIARTGALQLANGFVAGAGTDHLDRVTSKRDLVDGVVFQCKAITRHGGIPTILPMPWLTQNAAAAEDYVEVYTAIFDRVAGPVFVHWLGAMFLPVLAGYFPGDSFARVMAARPDVARGCKLSLLDADLEVRVRRELLPRDQIVLTGDDFHFGRMILGGDPAGPATVPAIERHTTIGRHRVALGDFSHALLGILDGIAWPAADALAALAAGDAAGYLRRMEPCEALGRHVFAAPTQHYKAGLALLAWLNGLQANMLLANREDLARDRAHYQRCIELARACHALREHPELATRLAAFDRGDHER